MVYRAQWEPASQPRDIAGFIIDLLDQVALMIDFRYEVTPTLDGSYGHRQPSGRWNGVIGQVIDKVSLEIIEGSSPRSVMWSLGSSPRSVMRSYGVMAKVSRAHQKDHPQ